MPLFNRGGLETFLKKNIKKQLIVFLLKGGVALRHSGQLLGTPAPPPELPPPTPLAHPPAPEFPLCHGWPGSHQPHTSDLNANMHVNQ